MLYFWFLMVFAGNWPGVGLPKCIVRGRNSLGPQHLLHIEQKQLKLKLIKYCLLTSTVCTLNKVHYVIW